MTFKTLIRHVHASGKHKGKPEHSLYFTAVTRHKQVLPGIFYNLSKPEWIAQEKCFVWVLWEAHFSPHAVVDLCCPQQRLVFIYSFIHSFIESFILNFSIFGPPYIGAFNLLGQNP